MSHALQVAELFALLVEADRLGRIELLELIAEPACWRSYIGNGNLRPVMLKPDSYLRLGVGDFEDCYFIEVDMGTEGSRALFGKLQQYLAYAASGSEQAAHGVFPKVLWLVPDDQRAETIEACIERLPHAARTLFGVAGFDTAVDVVADTSTATHT